MAEQPTQQAQRRKRQGRGGVLVSDGAILRQSQVGPATQTAHEHAGEGEERAPVVDTAEYWDLEFEEWCELPASVLRHPSAALCLSVGDTPSAAVCEGSCRVPLEGSCCVRLEGARLRKGRVSRFWVTPAPGGG